MRRDTESLSFFTKKGIASAVGGFVGLRTIFHYTGFATPMLPIVVGSLLGLLPAGVINKHLAAKYDKIFVDSPNTSAFCHFTIRATTAVVGILLGLIVTSLMVNLAINPFVLPALVAGGISAAIIIGLYAYAYSVLRLATQRRDLDILAETLGKQIDDMPNKVTIEIETDGSKLDEVDLQGLVLRTTYPGRGLLKRNLEISVGNKDRVIEILNSKQGVTCVRGEITEYGREVASRNRTISSMY